MLQNAFESLLAYSSIEWIGLVTGIIYVIFSAQNKIICWYFGIVSCACIAYHDFFGGLKLYSDGALQIFYIIMGIYGLIQWSKTSVSDDVRSTSNKKLKSHLLIVFISILISLVYGYAMNYLTDAAFPYVDAFTTVFSVVATWLLVNRKLSAWIYFLLIDMVMMYLYYNRGFDLYMLLYAIFTVFATYGIWNWARLATKQNSTI